jgi:hypothetical protein
VRFVMPGDQIVRDHVFKRDVGLNYWGGDHPNEPAGSSPPFSKILKPVQNPMRGEKTKYIRRTKPTLPQVLKPVQDDPAPLIATIDPTIKLAVPKSHGKKFDMIFHPNGRLFQIMGGWVILNLFQDPGRGNHPDEPVGSSPLFHGS